MPSRKNDPETVDRHAQAVRLRRDGLSYREIAERLGYGSPASAWKAVASALNATLDEPARELRALEADRLDAMWAKVWPRAIADPPDLLAMDRLLKISKARRELLGLDMPRKLEVSGEVTKSYDVTTSPEML